MTNANLLQAIGRIDPKLIADAAPDVPQKKTGNKTLIKWAFAVAACFALVMCAMPIINLVFDGSHSGAPVSIDYNSLDEAHDALGYETLYSKLNFDEANTNNISISYASIESDGIEQADLEKPLQLKISTSYPNGETTDRVDYYIIFNKNSVDDSYIAGYEEQGLTKEIGGITVHYSLIQDGAMHGQAKFLYEGNLYVIDVNSRGNAYNLDTYIDMVLN